MPAGGSRRPASHETVDERLHFVKQDGQAVFKFAVKKSQDIALRMLERNGLTGADLDLYVSHQANRRIIEATAERLGLPPEKVVINLDKYGNTTAATIPLALGRRARRRPPEARPSRAAGIGRRRIHGRVGAAALEPVAGSGLKAQDRTSIETPRPSARSGQMPTRAACRDPVTAGCAVSTTNSHRRRRPCVGSVNATSPGRGTQHDQERVSRDRAPVVVTAPQSPAHRGARPGSDARDRPSRRPHLATLRREPQHVRTVADRPLRKRVAAKNGLRRGAAAATDWTNRRNAFASSSSDQGVHVSAES